jgi:NAD-dependent SIR2 family protein deacetylase
MDLNELAPVLEQAAEAIRSADALLIAAGAGMGVDSGLPDFRGDEGFWKAYPPLRALNLSFVDLANPAWFRTDPRRAWGFYGHRMNLYRRTTPHDGFAQLLAWEQSKPDGYFVFTSNVDGQFQRAGFDPRQIVECHGSIHHVQCSRPCTDEIRRADDVLIDVDETDFLARMPLPACAHCGAVERPNILMFGDGFWLDDRTARQWQHYGRWREEIDGQRLTIIECGAGTAIPSVRRHCEDQPGTLIRINVRQPHAGPQGISIPLGARETLAAIAALLPA